MEREWLNEAACRGADPNLFFPDRGESAHEALSFCARCEVRFDCLALALREEERLTPHGVFGGTRANERLSAKRNPDRRFEMLVDAI